MRVAPAFAIAPGLPLACAAPMRSLASCAQLASRVDGVVRYEGQDDRRTTYRTVFLRREDGVAEGP